MGWYFANLYEWLLWAQGKPDTDMSTIRLFPVPTEGRIGIVIVCTSTEIMVASLHTGQLHSYQSIGKQLGNFTNCGSCP
jgi:hypothetical protein